MKLLTLNTHSLVEEHYHQKLDYFVQTIAREKPDVMALQEVNQTRMEKQVTNLPDSYIPCNCQEVIRRDNHAYRASEMLCARGLKYYWTWLCLKGAYEWYDEGIALMSISRILETKVVLVSDVDDYNQWKTRKIIGIRTEARPEDWFYSVHYGWWNDGEEPFRRQWKKTAMHMDKGFRTWLMGDFNSPAQVRGEGYDLIRNDGWHDTYTLAEEKDGGITVGTVIDGWRDRLVGEEGLRIDQIWCSQIVRTASSRVIFNGVNGTQVSDHYGVVVCCED